MKLIYPEKFQFKKGFVIDTDCMVTYFSDHSFSYFKIIRNGWKVSSVITKKNKFGSTYYNKVSSQNYE